MKIITLNVNGFRGMVKKNDYVSNRELNSNLQSLKLFISSLCIGEEDVIVLQEIPHKRLIDKSTRPWLWEEDEMFKKFKDIFEMDYTVFYPRFLIDSDQCTVALTSKKSRWKDSRKHIIDYNRFHHFGNKLIEIEKDNVLLLGVHINPCDEMWDMLINSLKKNGVTFIVGDFNAYEERGDMKNKPNLLRGLGYNSTIPSNVITNYEYHSSIDNLYIHRNFILDNGLTAVVKKTEQFVTDHTCCMFEM